MAERGAAPGRVNLSELRPEIAAACDRLVAHWSTPGPSWTAAQRRALAEVVGVARRATQELAPWQSPLTVEGLIATGPLPDVAVEVAWRITNHPGTLTKEWYDAAIAGGLGPHAFVELVGVVAMANALEHLCGAVGLEPPSLPEVNADPNAATTAETATVSTHWVPTVDSDLPNVRTALSAAPAELEMQGVLLDAFYVPGGALARELDDQVWGLERTQLELVASRVSTMNECFY